jgi:hypothetical protein
MAALLGPDARRQGALPARCVVGRSPACDLVLDVRDVSREHAAVHWTGAAWELQDLGSRNGTYLDGRRLVARECRLLARGAEIRFGETLGPWQLVDDAPPRPMAVNLVDGRVVLVDVDELALPDADEPALWLRRSDAGVWFAEPAGGPATRVEDRAVLTAGGEPWRVHLTDGVAATWQAASEPDAPPVHLQFRVSADEEHVELAVRVGERRIDLKARAHHYPLLVLARARLADRAAGVPDGEQGWPPQDRLLQMLKVDAGYLHLSIHRIRLQFTQAGVPDPARVVERRLGAGLLRLGVAHVTIEPL